MYALKYAFSYPLEVTDEDHKLGKILSWGSSVTVIDL